MPCAEAGQHVHMKVLLWFSLCVVMSSRSGSKL